MEFYASVKTTCVNMLVHKYFKISVILILEPLEEYSGLDDRLYDHLV